MAKFSGRTRSTLVLAASSPLLGLAGWRFWTRHSFFEPFTSETDPLFQSAYLKKFNPRDNPSEDDCCVRLVPLTRLRADLGEDALNGGPKLIEAFAAGLWGGFGFAIQRAIMKRAFLNDTNKNDLWEKEELLESLYEPGNVAREQLANATTRSDHMA
ncbi:hypothetical protein B0A52_04391 [Exophiala mesophila]|uniref:Uncharacterized protein n=1 Tax=Exophiala mesophila TaxID=212818 RepID=A0A438N8T2_EXOME|nr:hypothetical protein B0A52_04391 [Exophiala mesophila]